jgi:hypothetical protein
MVLYEARRMRGDGADLLDAPVNEATGVSDDHPESHLKRMQ